MNCCYECGATDDEYILVEHPQLPGERACLDCNENLLAGYATTNDPDFLNKELAEIDIMMRVMDGITGKRS